MLLSTILTNRKRTLGMNERNIIFVRKYNSKTAKTIADDKVITKKILKKANIPTTKLLGLIRTKSQLETFDFNVLPKSFVVKPANGVAGGGIEIFVKKDREGNYVRGNGTAVSPSFLKQHIINILDGKFSHRYRPDVTIIEERVIPYVGHKQYAYKGTADIRVLLFRKIPVMAMVRWPTADSNGKANLSEGAAASGIDIATGITTHSMKETKGGRIYEIDYVEGTSIRYSGIKIPYWDAILKYSVKAADVSGLGYCAVDFLIDNDLGPLVVELNARPGLRIQLINEDGLRWRLRQIRNIRIKSDAHAIRLGKDLFGGEVEEEIEAIAGKKVIALIQQAKLYNKKGSSHLDVYAKVDTGATFSSIDTELAKKLGYKKAIEIFESYKVPEYMETHAEAKKWASKLHNKLISLHSDIVSTHIIKSGNGYSYRMALRVRAVINDKHMIIEANVRDRSYLKYLVLIGKKALGDFLIDPTK